MYLVAALLTHPHPDPARDLDLMAELLRRRIEERTPLEHFWIRPDARGLALVLYITARGLAAAELHARALLGGATAASSALPGWQLAHCGGELVVLMMNRLLDD